MYRATAAPARARSAIPGVAFLPAAGYGAVDPMDALALHRRERLCSRAKSPAATTVATRPARLRRVAGAAVGATLLGAPSSSC
jgi:hypothetical protein